MWIGPNLGTPFLWQGQYKLSVLQNKRKILEIRECVSIETAKLPVASQKETANTDKLFILYRSQHLNKTLSSYQCKTRMLQIMYIRFMCEKSGSTLFLEKKHCGKNVILSGYCLLLPEQTKQHLANEKINETKKLHWSPLANFPFILFDLFV